MSPRLIAALAAVALTSFAAPRAEACGALVAPPTATVGQTAQQAFFSVRPGQTELVLQVVVPTSSRYGVIVPVGAEPTIDSRPIDSEAFENLERVSRPVVQTEKPAVEDDGFSLGCGGAAKSNDLAGGASRGVTEGPAVTVGPVEARKLSATDATALDAWLTEKGFALDAAQRATVTSYAGAGRWFVVFTPAAGASGSSLPPSIGVHLSLVGDARSFAMKMASVGAAAEVGFTVHVAAPKAVGVSAGAGFSTLGLADLDKATLRAEGYRSAVAKAVAARGGKAWVVEKAFSPRDLPEVFQQLTNLDSAQITRLSTVVKREALTADATFDGAPPADTSGFVDATAFLLPLRGLDALGALGLALAFAGRRRRGAA